MIAELFVQDLVNEIQMNVLCELERYGEFFDPVKKEIEDKYIGSLSAKAQANLNEYYAAESLLDDLLNISLNKAKEVSVRADLNKQCANNN